MIGSLRYFLNGDLLQPACSNTAAAVAVILHEPCSTTAKPVAVIDALLMFACHLTHESETAFS